MPLKYMMDIPEGVKYIGMAHGMLFITYIIPHSQLRKWLKKEEHLTRVCIELKWVATR